MAIKKIVGFLRSDSRAKQEEEPLSVKTVNDNFQTIDSRLNSLEQGESVLNALKKVDGEESGLDADMVDGKHEEYFMPRSFWNWQPGGGQPPWVWGGDALNNYKVYDPQEFSVDVAKGVRALLINEGTRDHNYVVPMRGDDEVTRLILSGWTTDALNTMTFDSISVRYADTLTSTSDARVKENVTPLDQKYIDLIKGLRPISFHYIANQRNDTALHAGFIAQEIEERLKADGLEDFALLNRQTQNWSFPEAVDENGEKLSQLASLQYIELIAPLVKTVQHCLERIEALEKQIGIMAEKRKA